MRSMITRSPMNIEEVSRLASVMSSALEDAVDTIDDIQDNYMQLRRAMKRLLECPALNANGLETEDQQAISDVLRILEATTIGGMTRRPPLEEL